jgi:hypothetical protein
LHATPEIERILKRHPMRPTNLGTIQDRPTLYRELERARLRGFATDNQEGYREYDVRFQFLDGDVGLDTHSVALLRDHGRNAEKPLVEDRWNSHADSPTWVDYWLSAPKA